MIMSMKDENGKLFMNFEESGYFCECVLKVPMRTLENLARTLNPIEYKRLRYYVKKLNHSSCTYRAWLAFIIYENDFMKKIFQIDSQPIDRTVYEMLNLKRGNENGKRN